jgi:hypothetical protein
VNCVICEATSLTPAPTVASVCAVTAALFGLHSAKTRPKVPATIWIQIGKLEQSSAVVGVAGVVVVSKITALMLYLAPVLDITLASSAERDQPPRHEALDLRAATARCEQRGRPARPHRGAPSSFASDQP